MAIGSSQGNVIASAVVRIQPDASGFGPALRQATATSLLQLEKQSGSFTDKLESSLKTAGKVIGTAAVTGLSLFSAAALKSAADLQVTSNALNGLFGSAAAGRDQLDAVFKLSEATPFEGSALAKDFQKLVGSFTAAKIPIQQASKDSLQALKAITDGGSALGATSDQIDSFATAVAKIQSRGKFNGRDLNALVNDLPGFSAAGAIRDYEGGSKSLVDVTNEITKGSVSSTEAIAAIEAALEKIPGAATAAQRQLRTINGAFTNLKDVFAQSVFDGLEKPLNAVSNVIVDNAGQFKSLFTDMASELGGVVVNITSLFNKSLVNFNNTFGKVAKGGLQDISAVVFGVSSGLNSSFDQFGNLGTILEKDVGYFVELGQGLGNISAGFSEFFTDIVRGFDPLFKTATQFFDVFSSGARQAFSIFGTAFYSAFTSVGTAVEGTVNSIEGAFRKSFNPALFTQFIRALAGVGSAIIEVVVNPLEAIGKKSQALETAISGIFKQVTPAIQEVEGALLNFGDSFGKLFASINTAGLGGFLGDLGKNLAQAAEAIINYGSIAVNVITALASVLQPVAGLLNGITSQLTSAFIVFKLTGSPLLGIISLFKNLDTGMLAFGITLIKVIPLLLQLQKAIQVLGAAGITTQFAALGTGLKSLATGAASFGSTGTQTMTQFIGTLEQAGSITTKQAANINTALKSAGFSELNPVLASTQKQVTGVTNSLLLGAKAPVALANGFKELGPPVISANAALKQSVAAAANIGGQLNYVTSNYSKLGSEAEKAGTSVEKGAANGAGAFAKLTANTAQAGETAGTTAATMSGFLPIIGTIGAAVGISLLTAHFASAGAAAAKAKANIKDYADAAYAVDTAQGGAAKDSALTDSTKVIADHFTNNNKALGEFNQLLKDNNLSQIQLFRNIDAGGTEKTDTLTKLVKSYLTKASQSGNDVFERAQSDLEIGTLKGRDISSAANKQAIDFYIKLAGTPGANLTRGLKTNSDAVQKTILDQLHLTAKEFASKSVSQQDALVKEAGLDKIFSFDQFGSGGKFISSDGALQLTKKYAPVITQLGQIASGAGSAADKLKQQNIAFEDSAAQATAAAAAFDDYTASQQTALTATSDLYNKLYADSNGDILNGLKANLAAANKTNALNGPASTLVGNDDTRAIISPFSDLAQSKKDLTTNVNAPISQTIDLLKKADDGTNQLAKSIGLTGDQFKRVQIATGDLSFPESFAKAVDNLEKSANGISPDALKTIVLNASTLNPQDQKTFIDNIIGGGNGKDSLKAQIEKQIKDVKAQVDIKASEQSLSDISTAIKNTGAANFNLKTLGESGVQNYADVAAVNELFAQAGPVIDDLTKKFEAGTISQKHFTSNLAGSRQQFIDDLKAEGVSAGDALAIFNKFGLKDEIAQVKLEIDGKSPEDRVKIVDGYLKTFSKQPYKVALDAAFKIDPALAIQNAIDRVTAANKNNKTYALSSLSAQKDADVFKGQSAQFISANVVPEIDPSVLPKFFADLNKTNAFKTTTNADGSTSTDVGIVAKIIPQLNEKDIPAAFQGLTKEQRVEVYASFDASRQHEIDLEIQDYYKNKSFPVKLKAEFEIDPHAAQQTFDAQTLNANHSNKKFALKGTDLGIDAQLSEGSTGKEIVQNIIPEILPKDRQKFFDDLQKDNPKLAYKVLANLDSKDVVKDLESLSKKQRLDVLAGLSPDGQALLNRNVEDALKNKPFDVKVKTELQIDPAAAQESFDNAVLTGNKKALDKLSPALKAQLSQTYSALGVATEIIPTIKPIDFDAYITSLEKDNPALTLQVIPLLPQSEIDQALAQFPPSVDVAILSELDPVQYKAAILDMTQAQLVSLAPSLDLVTLSKAFETMTKPQQTQLLAELPADTSVQLQAIISGYNLSTAVTLKAANEIQIPAINVPLSFINGGKPFSATSNPFLQVTGTSIPTTSVPLGPVTGAAAQALPTKNKHALGTITNGAEAAIIGEAGTEAVVPLGNYNRSIELLKKSGLYNRVLNDATGGQSSNSNYTSSTSSAQSVDKSINVQIDMGDSKTTDPEALAMFMSSRLISGIRR